MTGVMDETLTGIYSSVDVYISSKVTHTRARARIIRLDAACVFVTRRLMKLNFSPTKENTNYPKLLNTF